MDIVHKMSNEEENIMPCYVYLVISLKKVYSGLQIFVVVDNVQEYGKVYM